MKPFRTWIMHWALASFKALNILSITFYALCDRMCLVKIMRQQNSFFCKILIAKGNFLGNVFFFILKAVHEFIMAQILIFLGQITAIVIQEI